jgi:hypothetical protein
MLRDQPYLPLYVQDFLTDEKLAECSASATGVYIRLMCLMHKSEQYGKVLLKQKDKQTDKQIKNFALKLVKHLPYNLPEIEEAILELLNEDVIQMDGDTLSQKRMVRDCELSEKRSISGRKGGKKTQKNTAKFAKAKKQANAENENEYENDIVNEHTEKRVIGKKEVGMPEKSLQEQEDRNASEKSSQERSQVQEPDITDYDELSFKIVWETYEKKGNKKTSQRKWDGLPKKAKQLAVAHIPRYVKATPDVTYRKNLETYLNQEVWNDEILQPNGNKIAENASAMGLGNTNNGAHTFRTDADKRRHEREMLAKISEAVLQQSQAT